MNLTEREKEYLKNLIDRGEPLPPKYRLVLFADAPEVELIWQGKTSEVTNIVLPFQSIEQVDEPRAERGADAGSLFGVGGDGRQSGGWSNKLIWGDNKLVLSSLKNGPLRREIEAAGGLKLIYIDPPFDVGADFSVNIEVGEETLTKEPSVIEELAYRDTWGKGTDSYLAMMYERLKLMRDLLSDDGSIYVHVGARVSHLVRSLLEEIFGTENHRAEIIWNRTSAHANVVNNYGAIHDAILFFTKSENWFWNQVYAAYSEEYINTFFDQVDDSGQRYARRDLTASMTRASSGQIYTWKNITPPPSRCWAMTKDKMDELDRQGKIHWPQATGGMPRLKFYEKEAPGVPLQDIWSDLSIMHNLSAERLDYSTQKPEALVERIIKSSSNEGDLIADFFCGSGTTLAVAEKLGRQWIGCDLGRFAIHTTRKRLIGVQRELKAAGKPYRAFEILNLGKYERQYFLAQMSGAGANGRSPLSDEDLARVALQKEEHYLTLILSAYKAERVFQTPPFHGRKGSTLILVGPIDAPVTQGQVEEAVAACRRLKISKADVLGFEFEMGLSPALQDEAKRKGVALSLKYIPKDVFDRRAVERGQVQFYDVAYVEVLPKVEGRSVTVSLKDFGVYYRQDDLDAVGEKLKPGGSKVTVEAGQVVKVSKDKKGLITREVLTKKWTDWIDYWAVDFDYESRKEIIRVALSPPPAESGALAPPAGEEIWTGNYLFENQWQSFRTRKSRALELTSLKHEYAKKGTYKIAVKVIDIFGNDTTKVVEVRV